MREALSLATIAALPPGEALAYVERKGYRPSWDWFELQKEAHHRAFTVAKAINLDLLSDLRDEVEHSVRDGISYGEFERALLPSLKRHGWLPYDQHGWPTAASAEVVDPQTGVVARVGPWRLRRIYDTNLTVATQVGRFRAQTRPEVLQSHPYWQYASKLDLVTTQACRRRHGEIHRADDPWWDTNYPPNHWGCRAQVRGLTPGEVHAEVKDGGTLTQGGPDIAREVGKAGEGWEFNPGRTAYRPDLSRYPEEWRQIFEPQGLAREVRTLDDVEAILKDARQKGLFGHRLGMQSIRAEALPRNTFAQTWADGRFEVSTRTTVYRPDHRGTRYFTTESPKEVLTRALGRLGRTPLTQEEEASIQMLWHEILHNQQRDLVGYDWRKPEGLLLETLTEWGARHTYGDVVEWLGVSKTALQHQAALMTDGSGYTSAVRNFQTLLGRLGLREAEMVRPVLRLYRTVPRAMEYLEPLAEELATRSGKNKAAIAGALRNLKRERSEEFDRWLREL